MNFSIRRIRKKLSAKNHNAADAGAELARRGKWIAVISENTAQGRRVKLYYNPKPLLLIFMSLVVGGYLGCAVALIWWLDRSAFNRVGFLDVALPWRWSGMNTLRGEGFSAHGVKTLGDGKVQQGLFYLQRGLSLRPNNEEARLALTQFYAENNYYDGVRRTVTPQLEFGFSGPLAKLYVNQAVMVEDYSAVGKLIAKWRDDPTVSAEDREWMNETNFRAQMYRGDPEAALVAIDRPDTQGTKWDTMRVAALTRVGRLDEAWAVAEGLRPDFPGMFPLVGRTQAMVISEMGDVSRLRSVLDRLLEDGNLAPEAWIFAVEQTARGSFNEASEEYLKGFFRRFGARPDDVNGLVARISGTRNVEMIRKCAELAKEYQSVSINNQAMVGLFYVGEAEWGLLAKDWGIGVEAPDELGDLQRLFHGVLAATGSDSNDEALLAALNSGRFGLGVYRELTQGFAKAELWRLVKAAAESGIRYFPYSASLAESLAKADEVLSESVPDTRVSDMMTELSRRYEEADLADLRIELIDLAATARWSDLERIVRKVHRQRPVWLSQIAAELDTADARAGAAQGDFSRLIRLAPAIIRRDGQWADWFTDQAEVAIASGEAKLAKALLQAVLTVAESDERAGELLLSLIKVPEAQEVEVEVAPTLSLPPEN